MNTPGVEVTAGQAAADSAVQPPADVGSLKGAVLGLLSELRGLAADSADLVAAEARDASRALIGILVCALLAAVLGNAALIGLFTLFALLLVEAGLEWWWAGLITIALVAFAAYMSIRYARALVGRLLFPASRRQLRGGGTQ